jgi:tetratricopeptide (TPR) repeat protein
MMRWMKIIGLPLLLFVCAAGALCFDLLQWRLTRAERAFHGGDLRGAFLLWSSVSGNPSLRQLALLNRGVTRYRLGELVAASDDFRSATSSTDPVIRQPALYNLGTTLLVMERGQKIKDQKEAERLLDEALRQLQEAARSNPADVAAAHNKAVAQARLTALSSLRPKVPPPQPRQEQKEQGAVMMKQPMQAGTGVGKLGAATDRDSPAGRRRSAPELSHGQALRLLDDARGREVLRSAEAVGNRLEKLAPPEKDW